MQPRRASLAWLALLCAGRCSAFYLPGETRALEVAGSCGNPRVSTNGCAAGVAPQDYARVSHHRHPR